MTREQFNEKCRDYFNHSRSAKSHRDLDREHSEKAAAAWREIDETLRDKLKPGQFISSYYGSVYMMASGNLTLIEEVYAESVFSDEAPASGTIDVEFATGEVAGTGAL